MVKSGRELWIDSNIEEMGFFSKVMVVSFHIC